MNKRWVWLIPPLIAVVIGIGLLLRAVSAEPSGMLKTSASGSARGMVIDADGPVSGATVRMRATITSTTTGGDGSFMLLTLPEGEEIEITAWADGYYIASTHVTPTVSGITLTLRPYHTVDHPEYAWTSPIAGTSAGACGNCHPMILSQWQINAHGSAVSNPRFFSLYNGTNVSGTLPVGPGYQNDFPGTAGTCASCHAPGAGVDGYVTTNMNHVRDNLTAGIHCDYCHKIGGVFLDPATGSVYPNAPGAESQRMLRPPPGDNIFFGPYDDIHDPDTYLPLISTSQWCATCHQFSFWGTPIYESYQEWLASPYADDGITCQDCHMPPNGDSFFALPEVGGLEHPPETIPSHQQIGAADQKLLENSVTMTITAGQIGDRLGVTVAITNTGAGHHVPTDFPGRHLILVVEATGQDGQPLTQRSGAIVPEWGGDQAGLPGTAFAKVLRDVESGEAPVVNYWKQTLIESDNRIPALGKASFTFTFSGLSGQGNAHVTASLFFRRVFQGMADEKGWDKADIVMEEEEVSLSQQPFQVTYLPLVVLDS